MSLDRRYRDILATTESFLVSNPGNWSALDTAPLGLTIPAGRRFAPTSRRAREVIDGLHHLDEVAFGAQGMRMPRWVLFDCGAFPGIVFGFGRRAGDLPERVRAHYHAPGDDVFVPLSMWVAIRAAEEGAWFGHNLASANPLLDAAARLPGLATLTKAMGIAVARARTQYGATQWTSASVGLHLRFGDLHLLSALTPAHTHAETLCYRVDVDGARLREGLAEGWERPVARADRVLDAADSAGLEALQEEIEAGARWRVVRAERTDVGQRLHLCRD